jgi:myo-inositol 2-dehydrogenase/D-chiro-inositol 1-dehydrogenase
MAKETIGVAVLGAGFIAEYHLAGLAAAGGASVRMLVGLAEAKTAALAQQFGVPETSTDWRAALERPEIDAVIIATPDDTHEEIAVAAARAGKAILLQKPMAGTAEGCRNIIRAAEQAGVDLQVSFMHRWFEEVEQARSLLAEGVIGRVHSVRIRNATPGADWGDWFFTKSAVTHGVVDQLGVHGIDLAGLLVGAIQEVSARTAVLVPTRTLRDGRVIAVENIDTAFAIYGFVDGAMGTHEMSQVETRGCDRFRFELYGEQGTLWLRSERGRLAVYAPRRFGSEWHCPDLAELPLGQRHHAAWLAGLAGRAPRLATAREALQGMLVVEAIQQSATQGGARTVVVEGGMG